MRICRSRIDCLKSRLNLPCYGVNRWRKPRVVSILCALGRVGEEDKGRSCVGTADLYNWGSRSIVVVYGCWVNICEVGKVRGVAVL